MHSSPPPNNVFKYLDGKVNNIQDIKRELKNSKFKSKYYEFTSFFAFHLLNYKFELVTLKERSKMLDIFNKVSKWGIRHTGKRHFAFPYHFVLAKLMKNHTYLL